MKPGDIFVHVYYRILCGVKYYSTFRKIIGFYWIFLKTGLYQKFSSLVRKARIFLCTLLALTVGIQFGYAQQNKISKFIYESDSLLSAKQAELSYRKLIEANNLARLPENHSYRMEVFDAIRNFHNTIRTNDLVFGYPELTGELIEAYVCYSADSVVHYPDSSVVILNYGTYDGILPSDVVRASGLNRLANNISGNYESLESGRTIYLSGNTTQISFFNRSTDTNEIIRKGDLIFITSLIRPQMLHSDFSALKINGINFTDNYFTELYCLRQFLYPLDTQEYTDDICAESMKICVDGIAAWMRVNSNPDSVYYRTIEAGLFAGKSLEWVMNNADTQDFEYFIKYVLKYISTYRQRKYKFSESFAAWALYNSPIESIDLMEALLQLSPGRSDNLIRNFGEAILDKTYTEEWMKTGIKYTEQDNIKNASAIQNLINNTALVLKDSISFAHALYLSGEIKKDVYDFEGAATDYSLAKQYYTKLKFITGVEMSDASLNKLTSFKNISVVVQRGQALVSEAVFSPDGTNFATFGDRKIIKIWNTRLCKEVETLLGHTDKISTIQYSHDGNLLLSTAADKTIRIWNLIEGKLQKTIQLEKSAYTALFSPDDKSVYYAGRDSVIHHLDINTEMQIETLGRHNGVIFSLNYLPNYQDILISSGSDSTIRFWNMYSKLKSGKLNEKGKVLWFSTSSAGKYLLSENTDTTLSLWDIQKNKHLGIIRNQVSSTDSYFSNPVISPDERYVIVACNRREISIIDIATGTNKVYATAATDFINSVIYSPDGKYLLIVTGLGELIIYNMQNWSFEKNEMPAYIKSIHYTEPNEMVNFSTKSDKLFAQNPNNTKILDLSNGKTVIVSTDLTDLSKSPIVFGKESECIVINYEQNLYLYNYNKRDTVLKINYNNELVRCWCFNSTFDTICVVFSSGTINAYEYGNKKEFFSCNHTFPDDCNWPQIAMVNGYIAIVDFSKKLTLVNMLSRGKDKTLTIANNDSSWFYEIALSPDNKMFTASSSDNYLNFWSTTDFRLIKRIKTSDNNYASAPRFTPDMKYVAAIIEDGEIGVFDLNTGKNIYKFKDEENSFLSLDISSDSRFLVSTGFNSKINLYNLQDGNKLLTIYSMRDRDFVLMDDEMNYMADRNCLDGFVFKYNGKVYPFEQFDLRYNRPDLVLQKLPYAQPQLTEAYHLAYLKRLKKLGFTQEMLSTGFHIPELEIVSSNKIPTFTNSEKQIIKVRVKDYWSPVSSINVWINGLEVAVLKSINLSDTAELEKEIEVQLSSGINKIQVSCMNAQGIESLKESVEITYEPVKPVKPDLYILAMSVSNYQDSRYNLRYAVKDGRDIVNAFLKNSSLKFGKVFVDTLFNQNATIENFTRLKQKLMQTSIEDKVVLYVSGHGLLSDSLDFYYAAYDVDFHKPELRGISFDKLEDLLSYIPARKKLLLMDACHRGEVDKEEYANAKKKEVKTDLPTGVTTTFASKGTELLEPDENKIGLANSFQLMQEMFANLSQGSGTNVISAAAGNSFAYESADWENGVFTYSVIHGLNDNSADLNKNGEITISELREFVSNEVQELTKGKQKPTCRHESIGYDWVIK